MRTEGRGRATVLRTWLACGVLLAGAVVAGRTLADPLGDSALCVALGFAGGAVLASLADTVMPEAFAYGGPLVAFATTAGFFLSFVLAA
jgi:ZIP family zinc transporter